MVGQALRPQVQESEVLECRVAQRLELRGYRGVLPSTWRRRSFSILARIHSRIRPCTSIFVAQVLIKALDCAKKRKLTSCGCSRGPVRPFDDMNNSAAIPYLWPLV